MNTRNQMVCVWSAIVFAILCLVGFFPFANFIPPISPSLSSEEVAAIYLDNSLSMRFGILLIMTSAGFMCPFVAALAVQMKRIEGHTSPLAIAQISAGSLGALIFVFAAVFWTGAAFRPERDHELIMMLNDLGWITLLMTFGPFIIQNFALGLCILGDTHEVPILPRWVGFYNLWVGILFIPGGLLTFFKTGPFAWDGLFVWWIPFLVFFTWYLVMFYILRNAVKQQARAGEAALAST